MKLLSQIAWTAAGFALAAFLFMATWILWSVRLAPARIALQAEAVEQKAFSTLQNTDKATSDWADSAKQQSQAVLSVTASLQRIADSANGTVTAIGQDAQTLNGNLASLKGTTDAATGLTQALTTDAQTANTTIQGFQPLISHSDATIEALDARISDPNLEAFEYHMASISSNADKVTGDFQSRFHDLLYPPPCRTFGCKFSRYAWPVLKDGASFGQAAYWTRELIAGQKP